MTLFAAGLLVVFVAGGFLFDRETFSRGQNASVVLATDNTTTNTPAKPTARDILNSLTLEEKVGQLIMIGHWEGAYYQHTMRMLDLYHFGGVIIMQVPGDKTDEVATWTQSWRDASAITPLISIDQEGGVVSRLASDEFIQLRQRDLTTRAMAHTVGSLRGAELARLGINMNMAPVLDFASGTDSFLYERSFASTSHATSFANELIDGHKHSSVIAVPKHFPGHSDTAEDSHFMLPVVDVSTTTFATHVQAFTDLLAIENYQAIMTAHVLLPNIDPDFPATLSYKLLTTQLREQIGFAGVIITDDMTMGAITNQWSTDEATIKAINAGADLILFAAEPNQGMSARDAIIAAVQDGTLSENRIDQSVLRILRLKESVSD